MDIILSRQQTTKALIILRRRTGLSVPLLFPYSLSRFSHDVAHLFSCLYRVIGFGKEKLGTVSCTWLKMLTHCLVYV